MHNHNAKTPLERLFAELLETDMIIGVMEDYIDKARLGEGPDTPTDLTRNAVNLYSRHYQLAYQIEDYIRKDAINKERSKSRFKRLFNR